MVGSSLFPSEYYTYYFCPLSFFNYYDISQHQLFSSSDLNLNSKFVFPSFYRIILYYHQTNSRYFATLTSPSSEEIPRHSTKLLIEKPVPGR